MSIFRDSTTKKHLLIKMVSNFINFRGKLWRILFESTRPFDFVTFILQSRIISSHNLVTKKTQLSDMKIKKIMDSDKLKCFRQQRQQQSHTFFRSTRGEGAAPAEENYQVRFSKWEFLGKFFKKRKFLYDNLVKYSR